jgi:hypothetical protein
VALLDFEAKHVNELPLKEGQITTVRSRHGQGWLIADDPRTGKAGLIPEGYVRLINHIKGNFEKPRLPEFIPLPPVEEKYDGKWLGSCPTKCICPDLAGEDLMVVCHRCETRQHVKCYYGEALAMPATTHECVDCSRSNLDVPLSPIPMFMQALAKNLEAIDKEKGEIVKRRELSTRRRGKSRSVASLSTRREGKSPCIARLLTAEGGKCQQQDRPLWLHVRPWPGQCSRIGSWTGLSSF